LEKFLFALLLVVEIISSGDVPEKKPTQSIPQFLGSPLRRTGVVNRNPSRTMEESPADAWQGCSCHPVYGAPHRCSGDVLDQLKQNASRKTRRRGNLKTPIGRRGAGGAPKLRTEASKPDEIQQEQEEIQREEEEEEEIQREQEQIKEEQEQIKEEVIQQEQEQEQDEIQQEQEELDFSALLARRQQFVEEIRHKRFRSRKRFPAKKKKKKACAPVGLPSWFFADVDNNPLSSTGAAFILSHVPIV
jgi:flagellar biosynthesis GTPase FlhF